MLGVHREDGLLHSPKYHVSVSQFCTSALTHKQKEGEPKPKAMPKPVGKLSKLSEQLRARRLQAPGSPSRTGGWPVSVTCRLFGSGCEHKNRRCQQAPGAPFCTVGGQCQRVTCRRQSIIQCEHKVYDFTLWFVRVDLDSALAFGRH